jgi:hypothetical protein
VSSTSPDGETASKSSKTWAEEAKVYAYNSSNYADASQDSATTASTYANKAMGYAEAPRGQAPNGSTSAKVWAEIAGVKANSAASSASGASTSASNAKISETNAAKSASAAKQSEENAKTWDPTQYVKSVTESNGKITVTKGGGNSTIINLIDTFYPIGTVYMSADKTKTKADFPFMQYGTWEEVPANLCLQTGNTSEVGTQRGAGLPNIQGYSPTHFFSNLSDLEGGYKPNATYNMGAILLRTWTARSNIRSTTGSLYDGAMEFNASKSNPIYGSSNTVQPPAYMIRAWVRTA